MKLFDVYPLFNRYNEHGCYRGHKSGDHAGHKNIRGVGGRVFDRCPYGNNAYRDQAEPRRMKAEEHDLGIGSFFFFRIQGL